MSTYDLEIAGEIRRKKDTAAVYPGNLAHELRYIKKAYSPAARFAGRGVQDNRRFYEKRIRAHGLGHLLEQPETAKER